MIAVARSIFAISLLCTGAPLFARESACALIDGAVVINDDNEYLGKITNKFDGDSIFNKFGTHGSKFSSDSIWNKFGQNGNPYGSGSAFNKMSSSPPRIIKNGRVIALLTNNQSLAGAIDPLVLGITCFEYEPQ